MKDKNMLPARKLPGMFKKAYTPKKFKKKILDKIYIEDEKKFVVSIFSEKTKKGKKELVKVPADKEFKKSEVKSLKVLAKEIKRNKGVIKAKAFIVVASIIASFVVIVVTFKNPVAKLGIKTAMQLIYGSKCDIGSVNVEILGAKIIVNKLAQANPNHPMENFYEFEKLELDFNLTQLLRSRFNVQNIELTGIAINTPRTVSGALPVKKKLWSFTSNNDATGFYKALQEKTNVSLDSAKKSLDKTFAQYDPQKMIESMKSQVETPSVCKEIEGELTASIAKWKAKPEELKNDIEEFRKNSEKLASMKTSGLKTKEEIQTAIADVTAAIKSGQTVKKNLDSTFAGFESDRKKIETLQAKLDASIRKDKDLFVSKAGSFTIDGGLDFINSAVDSFAYSILGKYYPYLKKAISYAESMKASSKNEKTDKEAEAAIKKAKENSRKERKRYPGRYVFWRADTVPRILIENIHGSGNGIDIRITNVSSDMDKLGKPIVGKFTLKEKKRTHEAVLTVDARKKSSEPLIKASYSGNNFPFKLKMSKAVDIDGIPDVSGTTSINAVLTADSDFSFGGKCALAMNPITLDAKPISPEFADTIYKAALSSVNKVNSDCSFSFSEKNGIALNVKSDLEKQLLAGMKNSAGKLFEASKKEALALITEELNKNTNGTFAKFSQFADISKNITDQKSLVENLNKQLAAKQAELTKQMTEAAKKAVKEQTSAALSKNPAAGKAAEALIKGLKK